MNATQQKILRYVAKNQPVTVAMIMENVGITRAHYYEESLVLRRNDVLKSVNGIGVFAGSIAFHAWLDSGGRKLISENAKTANAKRHNVARKSDDDCKPVCQPYNRNGNCVVDEYMASQSRKRMMMVYGRAI